MERSCSKCKQWFKPTASQIKKQDHVCLICRRLRDKIWRARRIAEGRPYVQGKAREGWAKEWHKAYTSRPEIKRRLAELQRGYRRDPNKRARHMARWIANHAVESGKIMKLPCSQCGAENAQKHHPDYSKPLLIVWLCETCHRHLHNEIRKHAEEDK